MFFAVPEVYAVPVDLISKHPFRIMPRSFPVTFYGIRQHIAFVIRIERYLLDPGQAAFIKTQIKFCSELDRCGSFSSADGTNVRLADAYDPVRHAMSIFLIHFVLLLINFPDGLQTFCLPFFQLTSGCKKTIHIPQVAADVLKLLPDRLSDPLCCAFLASGKDDSGGRRTITLDEKISKAEAAVIAAKEKYDAALDEMEKLVTKRKQMDDKRLLEAYHAGDKTADEIIAFIQDQAQKSD